ncbi:MAG: histidine phosphatase family protein [Gammaproteobacteria bacterium]
MRIDLLRHGEPVGGRRYRGQSDDPLSELGWQQMWQAVGPTPPWQHIITSPLQRCRAFAQQLSERHVIPYSEDARFMEVGFGAWEGRSSDELRTLDPVLWQEFFIDPVNHRPAGAEPLADFMARVYEAWQSVVNAYAGQHVLIVCHAGVIRAVITQLLGAPLSALYRIQVETAALTGFRIDAERPPSLLFHGRRLG